MRQKSATRAQLAGVSDLCVHSRPATHLVHEATPGARNAGARCAARYTAATTDRRQARRDPPRAAAGAFAAPPAARTDSCDAQLLPRRIRRSEQHDLGPPPLPPPVALGHVRNDPGSVQVIEPALHALAMRADEPRPLCGLARYRAPAHHRRQPDHQLLHRRREPPGPRRVTEPEQIALDRVDPRLDPIVTRRDTTPRATSAAQQRAHHQPARLGWQRRAGRPIPTSTRRPVAVKRCAFQRHRQRPKAPSAQRTQRARADARGAAGEATRSCEHGSGSARRPHPSERGWRSVRGSATVGGQGICRRFSRSTAWSEDRTKGRVCVPVFLVLRGVGRRPTVPGRGVRRGRGRALLDSAAIERCGRAADCLRASCCPPSTDDPTRRRGSGAGTRVGQDEPPGGTAEQLPVDGPEARQVGPGRRSGVTPGRHLFVTFLRASPANRSDPLRLAPRPGRRESPAIAVRCGLVRSGSDGTRTRDLRRDRPAL
jgi:hypothetical protein